MLEILEGSEAHIYYNCSEVNVAQRLETSAESGEILTSYETYAHAQDLIEGAVGKYFYERC